MLIPPAKAGGNSKNFDYTALDSGLIDPLLIVPIFLLSGMNGLLGLFFAGGKIAVKDFGKMSLSALFKSDKLATILTPSLGWSSLVFVLGLAQSDGQMLLSSIIIFIGIFTWKILNYNKMTDFTEIKYPYQRLRSRNIRVMLKVALVVALIQITFSLVGINQLISGINTGVNDALRENQVELTAITNYIFVSIIFVVSFFILFLLPSAITGIWYGILMTPLFKHFILRHTLYIEGVMPIKYARFLDYAAEVRILEKDGGQWRFRHQNLQEYFARKVY